MLDILYDAIIDTLKLFPFLFIAFLFIEYIEHYLSDKNKSIIEKSGKFGPILGGILGIIPQCGFSIMATNLYVTRIVSIGTLVSIYLTCSDEMLPILVSEKVNYSTIIYILIIKLIIGIIVGIIIDFIFRKKHDNYKYDICDDEDCHCEEKGIVLSSFIHMLKIGSLIFVINFVLDVLFNYLDSDVISKFLLSGNVMSSFVACIIGLIPNCGASVMISELYINSVISFGALIGGLLSSSGVSLFVLFKTNKSIKNSFMILGIVYFVGVISGIIIDLLSIIY